MVESFWRVMPLLEGLGSVQDISTLFVCVTGKRGRGGENGGVKEKEREWMTVGVYERVGVGVGVGLGGVRE